MPLETTTCKWFQPVLQKQYWICAFYSTKELTAINLDGLKIRFWLVVRTGPEQHTFTSGPSNALTDCSLSLHGLDRDSKCKHIEEGEQQSEEGKKKIALSCVWCSFFPDTTQLMIMDGHTAPLPLNAFSPIMSSFISLSLTAVPSCSFSPFCLPFCFTRSLLALPLPYSRFPAGSETNSNRTSTAELMEDKTEGGSIVLFFFFYYSRKKKKVVSSEALPKFCQGAFAKAPN